MKPAPAPTSPSPSKAASADPLLDALVGRIPAQPLPIHYTFGLLLVAFAMVLIPVLYVGLIGALGFGWYQYALYVFRAQHTPRLLEIVFLVALAIATLFMIKPFLVRTSGDSKPKIITPGSEPRLFEFVRRICQVVGAPMPSTIYVNCEVNAGAGFKNGIFGIFSRKLVLVLGLPMVAGLTTRQFAGVLAHEMGHFTQRLAMRLSYIVRMIDMWLSQTACGRDIWDLRLSAWAENANYGAILYPAIGMIWLNRKIIFGLMLFGRALSCYLARQMEYDADRYEANLAGSDSFAATAQRMQELNIAWFGARRDLSEFFEEGRLPDNLPVLIVRNTGKIPPEVQKAFDRYIRSQKTGIFHTHPSDEDRNASVRRIDTPGIFHPQLVQVVEAAAPKPAVKSAALPPLTPPAPQAQSTLLKSTQTDPFSFSSSKANRGTGSTPPPQGATPSGSKTGSLSKSNPFDFNRGSAAGTSAPAAPAAPPPAPVVKMVSPADLPALQLFQDFGGLAKAVSFDLYRAVLGKKINSAKLVPVDKLVERQEGEQEFEKALLRFFQTPLVEIRSLHLAEERIQPVGNAANAIQAARDSRDEMLSAVAGHAFARMRYLEAAQKHNHLRQAGVLIELGLNLNIDALGIASPDAQGVAQACRQQQAVMDKELPKLELLETPAARRLVADLCLLQSPDLDGRIPELERLRAETVRLWPYMRLVETLIPRLVELRDRYDELVVLFPLVEKNRESQVLIEQIMEQTKHLRAQLADLQRMLGSEKYPFEHGLGEITLRAFAIPEVPLEDEIRAVLDASMEALGKLGPLYMRLLGRFCQYAEAVEGACGLKPLPDPTKKGAA